MISILIMFCFYLVIWFLKPGLNSSGHLVSMGSLGEDVTCLITFGASKFWNCSSVFVGYCSITAYAFFSVNIHQFCVDELMMSPTIASCPVLIDFPL